MSENNSKSTYNDYCNFCGNKITAELSKKIKANKENVVCELCGCQLLLITNINKEENRGTELITDIKKEHQEEIREELKEVYSLNIYSADREKFGYYLTIFTSRSIYNIIKQYNLGINITDIQIEMISNSIIVEIINNRVNNEWLAEFKPIKKKFKKCYRELQSELSLNQALHEVFLEFFRLLAKIIIKLINKKDYSELQVIEYDIAEYLIKRDLFVSNIRFTVPFRYNLKICLSRLIYLRIKDIACKNNLNFRQLKLSNIENRNISDEIIKYLITHNEIIKEFLGELESIKTDEFNEFYDYLCLELKSDNLFAESFNYYLRWLIGHVHNIVSGKYKWRELSHFDRIIGTKLAQLINVEVNFEKIREFKEDVQNIIEIRQENPPNPEVNELSAEIFQKNLRKEDPYSVLEFLKDIKKEISLIIGHNINFRTLSTDYLRFKNKWIVNNTILKSKRDSDYYLIESVLSSYEKRLRSSLKEHFKRISGFFKKYRKYHLAKPTKYDYPYLIQDFFKNIKSLDKSYWLGWILAEAHITERGNRIMIEIGVKDGILIKKFINSIGFDTRKVDYIRKTQKNGKITRTFKVDIKNQKFVSYLIDLGVPIGKKSHRIRFPNISDPLLKMAFLLGYFDGDGSHSGSPWISSNSKEFLNDIAREFDVKNQPKPVPKKPDSYYLIFSGKLFNELMDNYKNSLKRKRESYSDIKRGKFLFTKEELEEFFAKDPTLSGSKVVHLHLEEKGTKISRRTANRYLEKWRIKENFDKKIKK